MELYGKYLCWALVFKLARIIWYSYNTDTFAYDYRMFKVIFWRFILVHLYLNREKNKNLKLWIPLQILTFEDLNVLKKFKNGRTGCLTPFCCSFAFCPYLLIFFLFIIFFRNRVEQNTVSTCIKNNILWKILGKMLIFI